MNKVYFHQKSDNEDIASDGILEKFKNDNLFDVVSFNNLHKNQYLPWEYCGEPYDILYIPVFLEDKNFLNYSGVEFALHWYFYLSQQNKSFSIVLLGVESQLAFFKHCKYANFIKLPNVYYIDYNYEIIRNRMNDIVPKSYSSDEYIKAIKQIQIKPPESYRTHHSIANEWAIYRWSKAIEANDKDIENIISKVEHQLYFRYLTTIYPESNIKKYSEKDLQIASAKKAKILYVDDEADKGWYEILCTILYDYNRFDFDYLCHELKNKTQEEIISSAISKVTEIDADIVILDFRLHENDFSGSVENVTGLKILKGIKKKNPGIQVVIFSATNKTWNLQALQNAGADGFIVKESPENSADESFTAEVICSFISNMKDCVNKTFLKQFYLTYKDLETVLAQRKKVTHEKPLPKEFVDESLKWLKASYDLLGGKLLETNYTASYLFLFSVLENISTRIIDVDNPFKNDNKKFEFEFRKNTQKLFYFKKSVGNKYEKTHAILECKDWHIPWNQKIYNTLSFILEEINFNVDINKLIKKRNDIIHANVILGDEIDISIKDLIDLNLLITKALHNVT